MPEMSRPDAMISIKWRPMMVRGKLKKVAGSVLLGIGLMSGNAMADDVVDKPKVLIFDVNETLLDLTSMRSSVGEALGGREDLLPLWFSTMLHYSLVSTVTRARPFR